MQALSYNPTPIVEIHDPLLVERGVRVLIKREDLNNAEVSGNKYWKLKYNLAHAVSSEKAILTFGGAFSNHIYATAAAGHSVGLKTIGIIRGERIGELNPTLRFASSKGMHLHWISREEYRKKKEAAFLDALRELYGDVFIIPEGGTNKLAIKGVREFSQKYLAGIDFDHLYLPVGTGGTIAGMIAELSSRQITGVSVLKHTHHTDEIKELLLKYYNKEYGNWRLLTSYHHGGYARVTNELNRFIVMMRERHNLPLDHVYTAKMMFAIYEEVKAGNIGRGKTILALHTGGLQGTIELT